MEREMEWERKKGETTRVPLYKALVAAYRGRLNESREMFRQAMEDRLTDHDKEGAAVAEVQLALIEAHFGYFERARKRAAATVGVLLLTKISLHLRWLWLRR